jgi:hypothetical protein
VFASASYPIRVHEFFYFFFFNKVIYSPFVKASL